MVGVLSGAKASLTLPLAVMREVRLQGVTCGPRESLEAMIRAVAVNGLVPASPTASPLPTRRGRFGAWRTTLMWARSRSGRRDRALPRGKADGGGMVEKLARTRRAVAARWPPPSS